MSRLLAALKNDVRVQARNKLYHVGIVVAIIVGIGISALASASQLASLIPAILLVVVGGSTLLYVSGMILFERNEGTLSAVIVSPLRESEYLLSKSISLSFLAALEALLMIGAATFFIETDSSSSSPDILPMMAGTVCMGVVYTNIGIVMAVRYQKITDILIPLGCVASVFQLPALRYLGFVDHHWLLLIPTGASAEMIRGAYIGLEPGMWMYSIFYTTATVALTSLWALGAFRKHVIANAG